MGVFEDVKVVQSLNLVDAKCNGPQREEA